MALLAFFVLGAAYVGVYRLLSAEARRDRDQLLALEGGDSLWTAEDPGAPTSVDISKWKRAQERWSDRQKLEQRTKQIDVMFTGLIGAFVLQTGVTFVILVRLRQRPTSSSRKSRLRGPTTGRGARESES